MRDGAGEFEVELRLRMDGRGGYGGIIARVVFYGMGWGCLLAVVH